MAANRNFTRDPRPAKLLCQRSDESTGSPSRVLYSNSSNNSSDNNNDEFRMKSKNVLHSPIGPKSPRLIENKGGPGYFFSEEKPYKPKFNYSPEPRNPKFNYRQNKQEYNEPSSPKIIFSGSASGGGGGGGGGSGGGGGCSGGNGGATGGGTDCCVGHHDDNYGYADGDGMGSSDYCDDSTISIYGSASADNSSSNIDLKSEKTVLDDQRPYPTQKFGPRRSPMSPKKFLFDAENKERNSSADSEDYIENKRAIEHNSNWSGRRRHAINITSNPSYQVLHASHSTLDRTCSDSIVSLRHHRKSTSDLTIVATDSDPAIPTQIMSKRRGSVKGGLAYLANRRNSRDSLRSAASNTSLISNDEVPPLEFQASKRGQQRRTSNFLELPVVDHARPRVCSLPEQQYNPRFSEDLYRLRIFSISKGTVVNCGDSIISRRSRSNTSMNSTNSRASERSPFEGSCCGAGYANIDSIPPSPSDSEAPPLPPRYRVVMLGDTSVGKTALVSQFMTSEYMHTYDASLVRLTLSDDEFGEKTVSILLDGEESEMVFIDHPSDEMSVENSLSTYEPHGCVIVYSVEQRASFKQAEEIINYLWRENVTRDKAVILVGNKADLARSRVIPASEGKALAQSRDAKFIETSSGIQHNVDELLVGMLKQIRLKETRAKKQLNNDGTTMKMKNSRTHVSLHLAKELLQKICLNDLSKSKSCENLHVL